MLAPTQRRYSDSDTGSSSPDRTGFLHVLPTAVLERIAGSLLGMELFALSHTSSDALTLFTREHLWSSCLSAFTVATYPVSSLDVKRSGRIPRTVSSKQLYVRESRSFSFPGRARDTNASPRAAIGAFIRVHPLMRDAFGSWGNPFSLETWFSLTLDEDAVYTGGVIFGAQSIRLEAGTPASSVHPDAFAQLVHVDSERNLFCSVIKAFARGTPVALALESGRWYHLALVYAHQGESVYLDGEVVRTETGVLPAKWRSLYAGQVGTGFVGARSVEVVASPVLEGVGWRGFHGIIDSFRVYRFILSPELILRLAGNTSASDGGNTADNGDEESFIGGRVVHRDIASFCIRRDVSAQSDVQRIRCSRPRERWCQLAMPPSQSQVVVVNALDELIDGI
ncbi:hypothetical protein PybrP1_003209 [[Pythium] brassicae (nom. inval.)]|nr:hypothetical protein PybrP1_003209 [[Pythium] brassicae (nom. inval.)]